MVKQDCLLGKPRCVLGHVDVVRKYNIVGFSLPTARIGDGIVDSEVYVAALSLRVKLNRAEVVCLLLIHIPDIREQVHRSCERLPIVARFGMYGEMTLPTLKATVPNPNLYFPSMDGGRPTAGLAFDGAPFRLTVSTGSVTKCLCGRLVTVQIAGRLRQRWQPVAKGAVPCRNIRIAAHSDVEWCILGWSGKRDTCH